MEIRNRSATWRREAFRYSAFNGDGAYLALMSNAQIITEMEERPLRPALFKGWRGRCPQCGGGSLYDSYLKVSDHCDICGEAFHHHRADDAPAWLTIILIGHLIAPIMLASFEFLTLPTWSHAVIWPALALTGAIILLPRVKGMIIAFQWAHRMHGFDDDGL